MARGVNKVILVGNVGNDPETKYTQGGMAVTKLSLATTSVRKDRAGETVERTEWHRVTFFGKAGEVIGEHVKKGQQLYVEGSIRYDKYTGSDGVEKYTTDIIGDQFQFLGGKPGEGAPRRDDDHRGSRSSAPRARREEAPKQGGADFGDDDIPF